MISNIGEAIDRLFIFVENAGTRIAGKIRSKPIDGCSGAFTDAGRALRIRTFQLPHSLAQPLGIELGNGKWSHAALAAAGAAHQPWAALARGLGQRSVDNLDQFLIVAGQRGHTFTIPQAQVGS